MRKIAWEEVSLFKGPEQSPGFLLWQVSTKWRREVEKTLATLGVTHPQFVILAGIGWLTQSGNQVTQIELARHCETDITMTSQVLRTLEQKELIERRQNKGDERSKFSMLTPRGVQLVNKAIVLIEQVDSLFFGVLQEETQTCVKILQKLSTVNE